MFSVIIDNAASLAMLVSFLGGIAVALHDARAAIADALRFDGYALVTPRRCLPA